MDNDFGIIEDKINHGLFGATMTWVLEILPYLKKNNIYPIWNIDTYCYGNIFPSLIIPNKVNTIKNIKTSLVKIKSSQAHQFTVDDFKLAHDLFFEYFSISSDILKKVDDIKNTFGNKTLGVHFRGTDKLNLESEYISKEDYIKNINAFLSTQNDFDTIYVTCDEADFIPLLLNKISETKYKIIVSNSFKSTNNKSIHYHNFGNHLAKEALVDSLVLSKCDCIIKTSSALSDWVKIWNPEIEVYIVNKYIIPYFPHAMIPVKTFYLPD